MFVSVIDPRVAPIRLSAGVVRVFPIDPSIASVEQLLGAPAAIVASSSTIFGPDVSHIVTRRDSTVVFVRHTGV